MGARLRVVLFCVFVLLAGGCSFLFDDEDDCCCDDGGFEGALQERSPGYIGRSGSRGGGSVGTRRGR